MGLTLMSVLLIKNLTQSSFPFDPQEVCSFEPGDRINYNIQAHMELDLSVEQILAGNASTNRSQKTRTSLNGDLSLLAIKAHDQNIVLKAQFTELDYTINETQDKMRAKNLSQPLFFDLSSDCHITNFRFSKNITRTDAQIIKNILQEMQINLPQNKKTKDWESRQSNALGTYEATYSINNTDNKTVTLNKNKIKYTTINTQVPNAQTTSDITSSHFEIIISEDVPWLESMIGSEEILIEANNKPFMKAHTQFEITMIDHMFDTAFQQIDAFNDSLVTFEDIEKYTHDIKYTPKYAKEDVMDRDWHSILSEFQLNMDTNTPGDKRKALDLMVQYITHVKGGAQTLIQAIQKSELDKTHQSRAFLALELSGNREAQTALSHVIPNARFSKMNRMRAMIALQDVPNPQPEAVQTLFEQASTFGASEKNNDVASTALLSLGTLSGKNKNTHPEYLEQTENALLGSLETEANPDNKALYLTALGNTKDPELSDAVSSYLEDPSDTVRSAAARTLGSIRTPENEISLHITLASEESSDVRLSILKALNKYDNPSKDTIDSLANTIHKESNNLLRKEMIKILGKQAQKNQDAKNALVELQDSESNDKNIKLIGSYL